MAADMTRDELGPLHVTALNSSALTEREVPGDGEKD